MTVKTWLARFSFACSRHAAGSNGRRRAELKTALGVACVWLLATVAAAQVPTGTISGKVIDQNGAAVPGATVTATSTNLQGARVVTSSEFGDYAIPLLPPGDYSVKYELSGFQTVTRAAAVAPTQTVTLNVTLAVGSVTETVSVTGVANQFIETATVATNYRQELLQTLPTSRTLVAAALLAPNVHATGPNNTNGGDGSLAIGGAMSFDSLYLVNGVNVTENLRGQPVTLFIEDAIQETTISTGGISAEYGRFGGGMVNAITKSGGNNFSGSYRQSFNNDSWRATSPFAGDTKLDKTVPTYEYTLGGPVWRDRLWFFTAGRLQKQEQSRQTVATLIPYTFLNDEKRYEGKLTYSMHGHTVRGSLTKISQQLENQNFGNPLDLRTLYSQNNPQQLVSINYNGILTARLAVEAQYSNRQYSFLDAGSPYTDLPGGTLLIDRSRGGTGFRYWAPTFCACNDDERDNAEVLLKATYFRSTDRLGAHTVVFGYDTFNDHRLTNNHQSGSDYRILGTSTIISGTNVYPVFLGDGSTLIQWDNIVQPSEGTDLRVHSGFINDTARLNEHLTVNLGLRYDRNSGVDAAGAKVSDSSRWSPRLGVTWSPRGDDSWSVSGGFARYVSSLSSAVAENSPAGNAATYQFEYLGPSINAGNPASPVTSPDAITQVFNWFNANGGANRTAVSTSLPGVNVLINDSLKSPYALEYTSGVSRTFARGRGTTRFDYVFRGFHDFYAARTDLTTGRVTNSLGKQLDISLIENTDALKRRYQGGTFQTTYRLWTDLTLGGNYTLSRLWGNIDGENAASGPLTAQLFSYPEYREARWNLPEGNLYGDQRHRAKIYGIYHVPMSETAGGLNLSLLYTGASGVPYGLNGATSSAPGLTVGQIDPRPYVTNPGYADPLSSTANVEYFFFPRDQYRTEAQHRTDFAADYKHRVVGHAEAFFHADVLNIFNQFQLCACGGTVFNNGGGADMRTINNGVQTRATAGAASGLVVFNPFTETPVEGVNWRRAANFGTPANRFAYTSPRTFRFSVGVRF